MALSEIAFDINSDDNNTQSFSGALFEDFRLQVLLPHYFEAHSQIMEFCTLVCEVGLQGSLVRGLQHFVHRNPISQIRFSYFQEPPQTAETLRKTSMIPKK